MIKYLISLIFLSILGAGPALASTPPDVLARQVTDEVISIIRADKDIQSGNQKKARELIETKIAPHFNFAGMTQLALGRNWGAANAEQRRALTAEFRTLLVQTYTASLVLFKDQKIEYRPLKLAPDDNDVTVRSLVRQSGGGEPVQVDYGMEKTDAGWKVYNVKIGGISLVENYRSTFNTEIRKGGVDGLIASLRDKNRALVAQAK
ncbi:MAG: ABC transporter substrate-binding protein [Burkholderiales bacterium]|jgi:phospholipid transport system substrate-binding protein|nr:ABC transporter substrate-binding protein [Burkholderiales bacterium]